MLRNSHGGSAACESPLEFRSLVVIPVLQKKSQALLVLTPGLIRFLKPKSMGHRMWMVWGFLQAVVAIAALLVLTAAVVVVPRKISRRLLAYAGRVVGWMKAVIRRGARR